MTLLSHKQAFHPSNPTMPCNYRIRDAWNKLKGLLVEEAKSSYVELAQAVGFVPGAAPAKDSDEDEGGGGGGGGGFMGPVQSTMEEAEDGSRNFEKGEEIFKVRKGRWVHGSGALMVWRSNAAPPARFARKGRERGRRRGAGRAHRRRGVGARGRQRSGSSCGERRG